MQTYGGVNVRAGMETVRLLTRGESFDTVIAAIGSVPGHMPVTLEVQKCKPLSDAQRAAIDAAARAG